MARAPKNQKAPPGTVSTSNNHNGDISSINETPNSTSQAESNADDANAIDDGYDYDAVDADETTDGAATSRNNSVLSANRDSIWKYTEWVTLCKINTNKNKNKEPVWKDGWRCNFCKKEFLHPNPTKAICHLAGVSGMDICKCRGCIPAEHMKVILERNAMRVNKKKATN